MDQTIYQLNAKTSSGKNNSFEQYRGNVILIVNSATRCGHTPQLAELEEIFQKYKEQGLVIMAFPSDQFSQEPLEGEAVDAFCSVNYGVTFQIMEKCTLKGANAHPVFQFFADKKKNGKLSSTPYWNFYKYLIGRDGKLIDYYFTYRKPKNKKIIRTLEKALAVPSAEGITPIPVVNLK